MIFVAAAEMVSMQEALEVEATMSLQAKKLKQLNWMLEQPTLVTATKQFTESPVMKFKNELNVEDNRTGRGVRDPLFVYVFQKEFATAASECVEFIGTDEATTCIGLSIRNPDSGLTSVGHLDFVGCVRGGVNQMLASVCPKEDTLLEVHIVGAYDDSVDSDYMEDYAGADEMVERDGHNDVLHYKGHSWPLSLELIEVLHAAPYKLDIRTLCILQHNTVKGDLGYSCPVVRGLVTETASGRCMPAYFAEDARGPDGIVRGLSVSIAASGPYGRYGLQAPYDTYSDSFSIAPFKWSRLWKDYAAYVLSMSDLEILRSCSTSPLAESSDFLVSIRRLYGYLYTHPDWEDTFPDNKTRKHFRSSTGWVQFTEAEHTKEHMK